MENAATTSTACTNPGQVGPNRPCLLEIFSLFVCVCRLPQFQHQRWFGSLPGSSMPGHDPQYQRWYLPPTAGVGNFRECMKPRVVLRTFNETLM